MKMIKIAIIDDHELFREGLKLILEKIKNFNVVFDASNGELFLAYLNDAVPDIVLMDVQMPGMDGMETTIKALAVHPQLNIIALTMFTDVTHYTQMIRAGIKAFVLKKSNKFELEQAITVVYAGGNYFSQEILKRIAFHNLKASNEINHLSQREMDVLRLICKGATSKEISDKLFISVKTVEAHRHNILNKSDARNSAELMLWAVNNNYFSLEL